MFKLNLQLCLFLIYLYIPYGKTVNFNSYATTNQPNHLLHATNINDHNNGNANNAQFINNYQPSEQNLQGNSNYQQLYRYYYTPSPTTYQQQQQQQSLYYQQQHHLQPHQQQQQPTRLWSGPPIVVEDDYQAHSLIPTTTNIPPTYYTQYPISTGGLNSDSNSLSPTLFRNSKTLPLSPSTSSSSSLYNPQQQSSALNTQLSYNNNNNIIYHKDFRQHLDVMPATQQHHSYHQQANDVAANNQRQPQQQQHQYHYRQQEQQPQQFYGSNINSQYNGISNDLNSLEKENVTVYREHFKRYLENNPNRIKPIY